MLSQIFILVMISVISPAKSIIVEFKPIDFDLDFVILWEYYMKETDTADVRSYIEIPQATFTLSYVHVLEGHFLILEGTFIKDYLCTQLSCGMLTQEFNGIYVNRYREFFGYLQDGDEGRLIKIAPGTTLKYNYYQDTVKEKPYLAIKYAGLEEIQTQMDDVFQDIDNNKKYYSQLTYVIISYGQDGHFIKFAESGSCPTSEEDELDMTVLLGSVRNKGRVAKITTSTVGPILQYDIYSKMLHEHTKGILGIRMTKIGFLVKRDRQNEVCLFNTDRLYHLIQARSIKIGYKDIVSQTIGWSDCFGENPPLRLEKGFKFVVKGHVFIKRCGFPLDTDNNEVRQDGKKIIIDVAVDNPKAKFTRSYHRMSRSSLQLFFDEDNRLYMISENTQLLIDKFASILYQF